MKKTDTILITGASGLLGTALYSELTSLGYEKILTPSREELDLTDESAVNLFFIKNKPDYVFHLASVVFGLKGNLHNQWKAIRVNTIINNNVFSACVENRPKKIFFASTVAAYPYPVEMPLREESFYSGEPHIGEYGYASSKRYAHCYLKIMQDDYDIPFCYGLFTNIFGENDRFNALDGHVIPALILKAEVAAKNHQVLKIWGNPKTTRDFIYSRDAANAAICAMNSLSGIVNIASGIETSIYKVSEELINNFGELEVVWDDEEPIGISSRSVDISKLKALGWKPKYSFSDALRRTISWYKSSEFIRS